MSQSIKYQRTIDKIITKVSSIYGAPMGRPNVGSQPVTITSGPNCKILKKNQVKIYDCAIPMSGGYDRGGAYWGLPDNVRVRYTKDLSYIEFYRP